MNDHLEKQLWERAFYGKRMLFPLIRKDLIYIVYSVTTKGQFLSGTCRISSLGSALSNQTCTSSAVSLKGWLRFFIAESFTRKNSDKELTVPEAVYLNSV